MSDANTDAPPATGDAPTPEPAPAPEAETLGDGGLKALQAEREARKDLERRLRELEPLAEQARAQEEANKSELQKATEALEAAKADSARTSTELLQLRAAMSKAPVGTDYDTLVDLAGRLRGSSLEELEADAEALFARIPTTTPQAPATGPQRGPVESLRPGALPSTPETPLADQIRAAETAGDWGTVGRLKAQQLAELRSKSN